MEAPITSSECVRVDERDAHDRHSWRPTGGAPLLPSVAAPSGPGANGSMAQLRARFDRTRWRPTYTASAVDGRGTLGAQQGHSGDRSGVFLLVAISLLAGGFALR